MEGEGEGDGVEKGFFGVTVEGMDGAVVGEDLELGSGEENGEEPVIVFGAIVGGVGGAAFAADAAGAGGSVVAIGDIGEGDLAEELDEIFATGDLPDGVLDAVGSGEIVEGGGGLEGGIDEGVDGGGVAIGEENGAGICAEGIDEAGAIVFFIGASFLVFFDDLVFVVIDVAEGGDSRLEVVTHPLLVEIDGGLGLADQGAIGLEGEEIFEGFVVDGIAIGIDVCGEVDFCAIDVEEGEGVIGGEGGGFVAVDDIIGDAGDFGDESGSGAESGERFDAKHRGDRKRDSSPSCKRGC